MKEMSKRETRAPLFYLKDQNEKEVCLKDFRDKWVVLYFYPRDNTPGCTREALDSTNFLDEFPKLDAVILSASSDSPQNHRKFIEKHGLKVTLLSDPEHKVLEEYGVWQLKKRYGREYYGTARSTFIIDLDKEIKKVWKNVKVKGHVEEVKETLKALKE